MSHPIFGNFKNEKNHAFGFFSLISVGFLLAWVMVASIIDTTVFERDHIASLFRMFFIVTSFGIIFSHRYLMRLAIIAAVCGGLFVAIGMLFTPDEPNLANQFVELMSNSFQYITGNRTHTIIYERTIIWTLSLFFSMFVVFFSYYKFRFWVLFLVSVMTTGLAIRSPYFYEMRIFYTYIFCLLVLVVKYLYQKNRDKMASPPQTSIFSTFILGLTASVVLIASFIPTPPEGFSRGFMDNIIRAPFDLVNNFFLDITQPSEFSLRQIGFGESGGRLGGNVTLSDGVFMEIRTFSRGPLYLTGATSDTYTGYSWINLHSDYQPVDFNELGQNLELLEQMLGVDQLLSLSPLVGVVEAGNFVQEELTFYRVHGFAEDDYAYIFEDEFGVMHVFIDDETGSEMWIYIQEDYWWDEFLLFVDEVTGSEIWVLSSLTDYRGFSLQDIRFSNWFATSGNIAINNLDRRLTSVFHTGIVYDIDAHESVSFLRSEEGRFLASERLLANTTYTILYHDIDFRDWDFKEPVLGISYTGILEDVNQMLRTFRQTYGYYISTVWIDGISYKDLLEYYLIPRANRIHEIYTALPDEFPERVQELALEVTAEATNNYEKMVLLESFLSESFVYTLTPGSSPVDQDFVDHFLFELQQGYCVHFASAFVTMARSLGMPTRYVEGFFVNLRIRQDLYVEVFNNMAHAWPEVYFEGYGWVRFEPTPSSGLPHSGYQDSPNLPTVSGGGSWPDVETPQAPNDSTYEAPNVSTPSGSTGGSQQQPVEEQESLSGWIWVGLVVLLIVLSVVARVTFVRLRRSQVNKNKNNAFVIYRFNVLLRYLMLLGFELKETETALQFAHRIQGYYTKIEYERELLRLAVAAFTKARYSTEELTEIEIEVLEKLIHRIDRRMRDDLGKWKYWFYRYILVKI